jgi:hypothetical protein
MLAPRHGRREPVDLGWWSLFFIPVMFIVAGLSIPFTLVAGRVQRRHERAFRTKMQGLGRVVEWRDFLKAINETRGTVILERYSFKGPVRWWWTSENLYDISPYPTADWFTMLTDESFQPFAEWCSQRYTTPSEGLAFLADSDAISAGEDHSLWSRLRSPESESVRWVEVAPPRRLRGR